MCMLDTRLNQCSPLPPRSSPLALRCEALFTQARLFIIPSVSLCSPLINSACMLMTTLLSHHFIIYIASPLLCMQTSVCFLACPSLGCFPLFSFLLLPNPPAIFFTSPASSPPPLLTPSHSSITIDLRKRKVWPTWAQRCRLCLWWQRFGREHEQQ